MIAAAFKDDETGLEFLIVAEKFDSLRAVVDRLLGQEVSTKNVRGIVDICYADETS